MSKYWKILFGLVVVTGLVVGVALLVMNLQKQSTPVTTNTKSTEETELLPENTPKHEYTGYCALYGKYRQRYVECTGDYDPAAKGRAEAKAKECNESEKAVHGCGDRYY